MKPKLLKYAAILSLVLSCGCTHWKSCGTWTFMPEPTTPNPASTFGPTSVPVGIDFNFDPSKCNPPANCQCDRIVFIQIVRSSRPDVPATGAFKDRFNLAPDDAYFVRQTESGWSIDVAWDRKLAYYGLQDDGTPSNAIILIPGRNGPNPIIAHLHDTPSFYAERQGANLPGPAHEILFEAIDAAVCIQGDGMCNNKILGYFYWRVHSDKDNNILEESGFVNSDADYTVVVQEAIDAWNAHLQDAAPHKTALPSFSKLNP